MIGAYIEGPHPLAMPFVETIPKKVWKQHLATLKGMTLQSERTFKYTATAEQLHQVDDRWLGEGGTILLCVDMDGSLSCAEDACSNPRFGEQLNCRAQFHAAKHVLMRKHD